MLTLFQAPTSVAAAFFAHQLKAPFTDVQPALQASVDNFVEQGILASVQSLQQIGTYSFPAIQVGATISDYTGIKELSVLPPVGFTWLRLWWEENGTHSKVSYRYCRII